MNFKQIAGYGLLANVGYTFYKWGKVSASDRATQTAVVPIAVGKTLLALYLLGN